MFIRANAYTRKNGEQCFSYALLRSQRIKGVSRHKTLLNLGQAFRIPQDDWRELIRHVVNRLKQEPEIPFKDESDDFQNAVHDITRRLLDQGFDIFAKTPPESVKVFPDQMEHTDSRTVAGERLAMEELQIPQILRELGVPEFHVKIACAMVAGRMLHPGSECATHHWMCAISSILEMLELKTPHPNSLHNCADWIYKFREQIMEGLYGTTRDLLDFDETVVFYDLTNTFYHGSEKGMLLRRGRSKPKRHDCPLVTLALTLDASGFPRHVEILPGNAAESATLKSAIETLKGQTPMVIMDAGIATKKNLAYLKEQGLGWICVERSKVPAVPTTTPDATFTTAGGTNIRAWKLSQEQAETRVYLHSEARQITADQILETKCAKYEEELQRLHAGLPKPGYLKDGHKVGRLQEKYKQVSHLYDVTVTPKDRGKNKKPKHAKAVTFVKRAVHERACQSCGGYVVRSSHITWGVKTIAKTYWRLTEIENTFRVMKSDLGLRPLYHSRDDRIVTHMMMTVLAYHVAHFVRTRLKQQDLHHSWDTIRQELNQIKRVTTVLPMSPTRLLVLKVDQKLSPLSERIFHAVGYTYDPHATRTKQEYRTPDNVSAPDP